MKSILVMALTTVFYGYTSALPSCQMKVPINLCDLPPLLLKNSKVTLNKDNCGHEFPPDDFSQVPTVQWSDAKEKSLYTILFLGLYFEARYDLYWGVSNIPGSVLKRGGDISRDFTTLAEYVTPYEEETAAVFLYEQTDKIPANINITVKPPLKALPENPHYKKPPRKTDNHPAGVYPIPIRVAANRKDIKLETMQFTKNLRLCGPVASVNANFPKIKN